MIDLLGIYQKVEGAMPKFDLSKALKAWRKKVARKLGIPVLFQPDAADLLGRPWNTYRNWETGRRGSRLDPVVLADTRRRMEHILDHAAYVGTDTGSVNVTNIVPDDALRKALTKLRAELRLAKEDNSGESKNGQAKTVKAHPKAA